MDLTFTRVLSPDGTIAMKERTARIVGARLCLLLALVCLANSCDGKPEERAAQPAAEESEWQRKYEDLVNENEVVYRQLNVLKAENEELRTERERLREQLKDLDQLATLRGRLAEKTQRAQQLEREVARLREGEEARPEPKPVEPSENLALAVQRGRQRLEELGAVLLDRRQYGTAHAIILSALQLGSETPRTFFQLGVCQAADGRFDQAAARYEQALQALQKQPDRDDDLLRNCLINYAAARLQLGQPQEAMPLCLRAIELDETFAPAYFNLGLAYADLPDRRQEAVEAFRKHIIHGGARSVSARELIAELQAESAAEVQPEP